MIRVGLSKKLAADPAALARFEQLALPIARAVAAAIYERVAVRGRTATPPASYKRAAGGTRRNRTRYYITDAYAAKLGLSETNWPDSASMHEAAGVRAGTHKVTGGMWDGLQVRNFGASGKAAIIDFGGSSLGASSARSARTRAVAGKYVVTINGAGAAKAVRAREKVRNEAGEVQFRRKPKLVQNWMKAGTVFKHAAVGLLQPTDRETADIADVLMDSYAITTAKVLGGEVFSTSGVAKSPLYRAIAKDLGIRE
jgi:hypothetical protein